MSSGALHSPKAEGEGESGRDDVTRVKRRRLLNLVDLRGPGGMTSSSVQLVGPSSCLPPLPHPGGGGFGPSSSLGHGRRSRTPLTDLDSKFVTKSGLCVGLDTTDGGSLRGTGGMKITHLTGHVHSGVPTSAGGSTGVRDDTVPRFPRLDQCAHFHYEYVELPPIQVSLVTEELKPLSQGSLSEDTENRSLLVQVTSLGRSWVVRRTYDNFRFLDKQLHRCCYDRKFSQLGELPPEENLSGAEKESAIETTLREYLRRLSEVAGSLITCGPVLGWLELDNRGHRLIVTDDSDINTPAVAAAYVVKRYTAQASDEISFEVGDMISVIDMPPPEESIWWRGKRGFQVGFFPCECVQVIGDKVPQAIHPQALTLPPTRSSSTPPTSGAPHHSPLQPSASLGSTSSAQEPMKPVLRKHGKLIAFFRSFILSRPSRRRLKQSGILRERVFGCDLGEHLLNSGHEIPMVLRCCSEFIESHGTVDGIYRLSGITSNIQKLRNAFDEERVPDLYGDESILQDIHCVSSVLKMYFRELPNPLLTYQLYDKFVTAVMQSENIRLFHVRDVVQQLPPPHYRTLEYLIQHLARIASHSSNTGMTPRNIAIVWAPNLLRSKDLEKGGVAALQDVGTQAVVTEYLVRFVDLIFNDKIPIFSPSTNGLEGTPKKLRPKSLAISTPTKLLSIDEARSRALAAIKSDQKYIEVGGGPQSLPKTYHTVIDLPSRKGGSLKQKKSPLGWKTIFSKNKHQRKASTPNDISLNVSDPVVTETDLTSHSLRLLRPVKSVESLVSTPASLQSNRNSQMVEATPKEETNPTPAVTRDRRGSASSECSSIPSPRTHNRSVSHDSYFNLLERSGSASASLSGAVKEERESDTEFSPESSKIFLDISELNIDFNTSEAEMKIFSEDETLKSTSIEDTLSRSTDDIGENISMGSDLAKSKENVSSREKRSLKDKLKKRFTSPSMQRKDNCVSDSSEDSRSNSLKRASSVIKDKLALALSPEISRKKGGDVILPAQSRSPEEGSPKSKQTYPTDSNQLLKGDQCVSVTLSESEALEDHSGDDDKERMSIESTLIDPDLLDKITRMRVSPSVSASEASSVSLAEATVSDNESFTLGSSSNAGSNGVEGAKEGAISDTGSTMPQSLLNTPCTPPVTIVADPEFQEEISRREQEFKGVQTDREAQVKIKPPPKPARDRPNSLLGIPPSDSCGLGSSLTSPETPQGDSTFLEIQYHPLSDTTEPSTPSESHFTGCIDDPTINIPPILNLPRQSSPLSPDISSSSTEDLIENGPLYENVRVGPSESKLSNLQVYCDSSCKVSPEVDTPTVEESSLEYENINYKVLEQSFCEEADIKGFGSDSVTPCYENLNESFPVESSLASSELNREDQPTYENVSQSHEEDTTESISEGEYEEYSFSEQTSYEIPPLEDIKREKGKSEAEIQSDVVYQQVKYLRKSIQEVNEILNETVESSEGLKPCQPLQSVNLTLCQPLSPDDSRKEDKDTEIASYEIHEGSECLDSPVTPSSSSLVTEVLVLPSFSSPTESTTEDATSPDASESQNSPQILKGCTMSPNRESPSTVPSSPNSLNSVIPTLSPPSPEISAEVTSSATSTATKTLSSTLTPSPWPRGGTKPNQVWPPVPKPRNLPALNIISPLLSPTSPPDSPNRLPELLTDQTPTEEVKDFEYCSTQPTRNVVHVIKMPGSEIGIQNEGSHLKGVNKFEKKSEDSEFETTEVLDAKPLSAQDQHAILFDTGALPAPPEEDEAQKRERIEKYKRERRSYLREKYKSESFKGEKDDMLLRLKHKATSPSRQEDSENASIESCSKEKSEDCLDSQRVATDEDSKSNLTNPRFQTSTSSNSCNESDAIVERSSPDVKHSRDEPFRYRSVSENSKVLNDEHDSGGGDKRASLPSPTDTKKSPTRTYSDSTFQAKNKLEEDVNVKERVAIWSRQEGSSQQPSHKREGPVVATLSTKVTPPKLRKIQTPSVAADFSFQKSPKRISLPSKTPSTSSPSGVADSKDKPTSISRNGRNPPYQRTSSKSNTDFPPLSPPHSSDKGSSTKPSPVGKSLPSPQSGGAKRPPLLSQKSESDLREPVPLKTRSYSVGTGLCSPAVTTSNLRCTNSQQKRIKDMKALFERDIPKQDASRPVMIRQSSREGVGD